ncbi:hypothetical protein PAERUG_E15_London_28_01_14_08446 [Pseudomonas aeruginosa]|nr:hypothetical protein PAERUG_E15_London_28_01_14_08446 [Pseudomonas aeruginosa]
MCIRDHHQCLPAQRNHHPLDFVQGDVTAGRVRRGAQEHQLGTLRLGRIDHRIQIGAQAILAVHQRHFNQCGTLQARADGVHAEHRRRDQHAIATRHAQRAYQQINGLVAAAADQQLLRRHAVQRRQAFAQRQRLRLRIAPAAASRIGRIGPGRLVGVQPDLALHRRTACRAVAGERLQIRAYQRQHILDSRAHAATSMRNATARSWASRPSALAMMRAQPPIAARPAALALCTLIRFWKLATLTPL